MSGMEHAIDRAARAEAERKGRDEYWCGDPDVFAAGAEWAVEHLREAGLLAPAPLREVTTAAELDALVGHAFHAVVMHGDRQESVIGNSPDAEVWQWIGWPVGMWLPEGAETCPVPPQTPPLPVRVLYVDRAEGDGRADCHCAHCHSRPYSIMHICSECGSKRCPRAAHHENRCAEATS